MLIDAGIWISRAPMPPTTPRAGLLLDRDGVVVKEVQYLGRADDVALENGIAELVSWAASRVMPVAVVTNQAGIARGLYDWPQFEAVEAEIARRLAATGNSIDLTVACPFHPDFTPGYGERQAYWRKPGPGQLELALTYLSLDPTSSWMIGDKASDIAAARNAGLPRAIHVLSGHGRTERPAARALASAEFQVIEARDNIEALAILKSAHSP
jgi:D-glycero-D-manno-heptose 1,7-bisphosphate phosphatase